MMILTTVLATNYSLIYPGEIEGQAAKHAWCTDVKSYPGEIEGQAAQRAAKQHMVHLFDGLNRDGVRANGYVSERDLWGVV